MGVTGNTIFSQDRRRLNYTVMFSSTPRDMWGVGYNAGRYNKPVSYTEKHYLVEANYLYRILPKTYVGTVLSFEHTAGKGLAAVMWRLCWEFHPGGRQETSTLTS